MNCLLKYLSLFLVFNANSQITQSSYANLHNNYSYTYWNDNFKTTGVQDREFTIQTSDFGMKINYSDLTISNMDVITDTLTAEEAFNLTDDPLFPISTTGDIRYRILQDGNVLHDKSTSPTNSGIKVTQMSEYGTWLNRRFLDSLNYTNSPDIFGSFSGIEFTNWHNRIKMTFYVRPRTTIMNGQLEFEIELPSVYSTFYNSGAVYGFANAQDQGFAVKGGTNSYTTAANSGIITTALAPQNLIADSLYQVSLIFYPVKENLSITYQDVFDDINNIIVTSTQTLPNTSDNATINYDANEGVHYIDIPAYTMGQYNCSSAELLQNIQFSLENPTNQDRRARLCFRQVPAVNVTGFSSMLRSRNGDPLGIPLQISKNWHGSPSSALHAGSWIKEYTELIIPANSIEEFDYTRVGAKWGETYGAFSHQLSVVGAGVWRGGWLEAGLGSFGENITHSPDYEYGNSNGCDFRPFLVTNQNQGGTSQECRWTGNLGGLDFGHYTNSNNQRIYQSQVKTKFKRYGPNLSETSISAISSDLKLKLDYTFHLNRSNDMTRVYYKLKLRALDSINFNRFDLFQLGGDIYNTLVAQSVVYGSEAGVSGIFAPTNSGSNDYTSGHQALNGNQPWIWIDGECNYSPVGSNLNIDANAGVIIRSYSGVFNGITDNTPYLRERSSSIGFSSPTGLNPTSYCLVPPQGVTGFSPGDSIELLLEVCLIPKSANDYYGNDSLYAQTLSTYGNSWQPLFNEVVFNQPIAFSDSASITQGYPIRIETINNEAMVEIEGGKNYVPIIFTHLDSIYDPSLWKRTNNCWELIDQSNWGKDFWQTDYDPVLEKFEITYNVNDDIGDSLTLNTYYFGNNPPPVESTDTIVACDSIAWIDGVTYVTSTTNVMDTLLTALGCDSLVRLDLTIYPSDFSIDVISSCEPYTWIDGITYTASNSGASYILQNVNGCDSTITLNFTLDSADVSVIDNSPTLVASATNAVYQWIDCATNTLIPQETSQAFTAQNNGSYAVIVDDGICIDTSICVTIDNVGVAPLDFENDIILFPNPTKGELTLQFTQPVQTKIKLITLDGREVLEGSYNDEKVIIDLCNMAFGVYFLEVSCGNGNNRVVKQVIKN